MKYIAIIEGQEIPLDEAIAQDDNTLKTAISVYFPEYANAEIERQTTDDTVSIRLVKKAGTKGSLFRELNNCFEEINPALKLGWQIKLLEINSQISLENLITLQPEIDKAIKLGQSWETYSEKVAQNLKQQPAIRSKYPVL
ncbi:hypothetical protein NIES593_17830 [Hydrococcus rivularis NIES-593]|uniref:Uncharacterized protein n=1 Tax=Hydrococcus rivularis NIES-593 TaxID=1921803 RepID=A0A1U7HAX9_9CYAN|nr:MULTISPECIES: hypothetical protein [Cyanophyceae]MBD2497303.1 hypothetical protein [Nostoc sp. FACHB-280]OKH20714.1 hypothetical protein NIES593_17830 [Hydrococcus rivularis NIES-593]